MYDNRIRILFSAVALFFTAAGTSALAQPWQMMFVHAGETKTITVPTGKIVEFLPSTQTPNSGMGLKVDFGNNNVIPPVGIQTSLVSPPTVWVGPVTLSLIMSKTTPYTTAASFVAVTYRFKDNL